CPRSRRRWQDHSARPREQHERQRENLQRPKTAEPLGKPSALRPASRFRRNLRWVAEPIQEVHHVGVRLVDHRGAFAGDVPANLIDYLVALCGGQIHQLDLEAAEIRIDQLTGTDCGHLCPPPSRKISSTELRNLNHSSRKSATAFWPERLSR